MDLTTLKGLAYFEDVEAEPIMYKIGSPPTFEQIKQYLIQETKKYLN